MNKLEGQWLNEVSGLGCIVCLVKDGIYSPALIHHIRTWHGRRITRNHKYVLPMCHAHHDGGIAGVSFHKNSTLWCEKYGSQEDLLEEVHNQLIKKWGLSVFPNLETSLKRFESFLSV